MIKIKNYIFPLEQLVFIMENSFGHIEILLRDCNEVLVIKNCSLKDVNYNYKVGVDKE